MSEHLNVGDVTGPRWAGGTRNPDDAETTYATGPIDWELTAEMFKADNLVLREQLAAQSRKFAAATPELRTSRGEHDALIEQARFYSDGGPLGTNSAAAKRFGLLADAVATLRGQLAAAEAVIDAAGEAIKRMDVLEASQSYGVRLPYGEIETVQKVLNAYRTGDAHV